MYYEKGVRINRDDFDSVKHVYFLPGNEIFSIQKLEGGLYQIESIDNPGKIIVLSDDDLQEQFSPIELLEETRTQALSTAAKLANDVRKVL